MQRHLPGWPAWMEVKLQTFPYFFFVSEQQLPFFERMKLCPYKFATFFIDNITIENSSSQFSLFRDENEQWEGSNARQAGVPRPLGHK